VATSRVSSTTRKEDDRLRKELLNADIGKFKKALKSVLFSRKKAKKRVVKHD
jgi:hypothetical protein